MSAGPLPPPSPPLPHRVVLDVRRLPGYGHGTHSTQWWGIIGF